MNEIFFLQRKFNKIYNIDFESLFNTFPNTSKLETPPSLSSLSHWHTNEIYAISNSIDMIEHSLKLTNCCTEGCSHCCRQAIFIDPVEYELIKYNLLTYDYTTRRTIKNVSTMICRELERADIPVTISLLNKNELTELSMKYFSLNLKCPFLNHDNRCIIYTLRPFTCLSYRNYGNPNICKTSCNPKCAYAYSEFDVFYSTRLYENALNFLHHDTFYLLPYALTKIL